ncbi:MAG: hypothetical protein ACLUDU_01720 [Butyricimonas faecihominis]
MDWDDVHLKTMFDRAYRLSNNGKRVDADTILPVPEKNGKERYRFEQNYGLE